LTVRRYLYGAYPTRLHDSHPSRAWVSMAQVFGKVGFGRVHGLLERSVHMLRSCAHACAGSDRRMAHASIGALWSTVHVTPSCLAWCRGTRVWGTTCLIKVPPIIKAPGVLAR
jgi:hypothetical protein